MCFGIFCQDYNFNLLVFIGYLVDIKVLINYFCVVFFIFIDIDQSVML